MSAIAEGLLEQSARIASGLFCDAPGSRLFEAITLLAEYGLTRAEAALLAAHGPAMAAAARARLGPGFPLVDRGAGSCAKAGELIPILLPRAVWTSTSPPTMSPHRLAACRRAFPLLEIVGGWARISPTRSSVRTSFQTGQPSVSSPVPASASSRLPGPRPFSAACTPPCRSPRRCWPALPRARGRSARSRL